MYLYFEILLIVVEGAKTPPKMLTHFHRAWASSRMPINVLRDEQVIGRPRRRVSAEEAPGLPAESEAPGTKINSRV
jgi:hypothetical protein